VAAIALLLSWAFGSQLFPAGRELIGKPAPSFSLPVLANGEPGARMSLSELGGVVVVVDFWATWCEPCLVQAPILERVAQAHPDDVVVLGVSVDEDPELARRFVRQKRLTYPIVVDDTGVVQAAYGARTLPLVVVIDPAGRVAKVLPGLSSRSRLEDAISAARQQVDR
jgi:thiol-disulfide isomerase/thioredoxin